MANVELTNITPPRVPLIDQRTGLISREWYRFFLNLFQLTGEGRNTTSLTDLQLGPPVPQQEDFVEFIVDVNGLLAQPAPGTSELQAALDVVRQELQTLPPKAVEELQQQLITLRQEVQTLPSFLLDEVAELQKQVQALQVAPPPREFKRSRYGAFLDTTTQTATTVNTATAITFNTTDLSQGVYLGTPTSRVYVDTESIYDFQTSLQLDSNVSTDEHFYLWIAINGVDVPNSASTVRLKGNDSESILALNFFLNLKAGDYVEFYFSVTDLGVRVQYVAATPPVPAIPSIILTVSNNIQGVQ